jgi:hypothetical protein
MSEPALLRAHVNYVPKQPSIKNENESADGLPKKKRKYAESDDDPDPHEYSSPPRRYARLSYQPMGQSILHVEKDEDAIETVLHAVIGNFSIRDAPKRLQSLTGAVHSPGHLQLHLRGWIVRDIGVNTIMRPLIRERRPNILTRDLYTFVLPFVHPRSLLDAKIGD